ncbi:MAG: TlpA family protein disulfide reductase [Salinibacter sp.]|uniref:TlpA family protein disulfide reductase n=1 Tax=Salinibacter sp. TaxID=2065818 RepID=UPI0035D415D5
MRRLSATACLFGLIALLVACGGNDDQNVSSSSSSRSSPSPGAGARAEQVQDVTPKPVPDLTLKTLDGRSIRLAQQEGRVLLINFWATWCGPCRKEIPDLKALHSKFNSKGLTVIGVALDRKGREVVKPYVEEQAIDYPIVVDSEGTVEAAFGPIRGLPTTVVVNANGKITKRILGLFPTDQMRPVLRELLAAGGASSGPTGPGTGPTS